MVLSAHPTINNLINASVRGFCILVDLRNMVFILYGNSEKGAHGKLKLIILSGSDISLYREQLQFKFNFKQTYFPLHVHIVFRVTM